MNAIIRFRRTFGLGFLILYDLGNIHILRQHPTYADHPTLHHHVNNRQYFPISHPPSLSLYLQEPSTILFFKPSVPLYC